MLEVLSGVAMCVSMGAQVVDAYFTMKGLDKGDVEAGIINRLFVKSKADESKVSLITFVEAAITLALFGAVNHFAGASGALIYASSIAALEIANDVHSFILLRKQKAI
jgi:hypothetical protein